MRRLGLAIAAILLPPGISPAMAMQLPSGTNRTEGGEPLNPAWLVGRWGEVLRSRGPARACREDWVEFRADGTIIGPYSSARWSLNRDHLTISLPDGRTHRQRIVRTGNDSFAMIESRPSDPPDRYVRC